LGKLHGALDLFDLSNNIFKLLTLAFMASILHHSERILKLVKSLLEYRFAFKILNACGVRKLGHRGRIQTTHVMRTGGAAIEKA
jgi:hypothetical protein